MIEVIYVYGVVITGAYFLANGLYRLAVEEREKVGNTMRESVLQMSTKIAVMMLVIASMTVLYAFAWPASVPWHFVRKVRRAKNGCDDQ